MAEQRRGRIERWTRDQWTSQRWTTLAPLILRVAAAMIRADGLAVGWYKRSDGRLDAMAAIHEVAEQVERGGGVDEFAQLVGAVVGQPGLVLEPLDLLWQYLSTTPQGRADDDPDHDGVVSLWSDSVGTTAGVAAALEAAADYGDAHLQPDERPSTAHTGTRRRRSRAARTKPAGADAAGR
jgi:hypothetical protein